MVRIARLPPGWGYRKRYGQRDVLELADRIEMLPQRRWHGDGVRLSSDLSGAPQPEAAARRAADRVGNRVQRWNLSRHHQRPGTVLRLPWNSCEPARDEFTAGGVASSSSRIDAAQAR